jgi:serine/threonine-protein kinase RsbW
MDANTPYSFNLTFPANVDYIPAIRKYVAEVLQVLHFTQQFSFRSEVVVDEICHNAIMYGSQSVDAVVGITCTVFDDRIELQVHDEGGNTDDVEHLKAVLEKDSLLFGNEKTGKGLGLQIVKLLSEDVQVTVGERNKTSIQLMRKK